MARNETGVVIYPEAAITFALICCVILIIAGCLGNLLTVLALLRSRKLRLATTSVFILSLCTIDLIFCSFNLPLTAIRYAHQAWILGETLCKLFPFFFYLNVAASLFSMMAISINRFILIGFYRLYDRIYTRLNTAIMIFVCWLIPLLLLLPTLAGVWGCFGYRNQTFSCTILEKQGKSSKKALFLIGFILPCSVIILCYGGIFWIVRRSRKNLNTYSPSDQKVPKRTNGGTVSSGIAKRQVDEMNLTRMVLAIFVAFLLCYLPLMVVNVFDDQESVPSVHVVASVLAWSAAVVNPFLYAVMNRRYRKAYISLLPNAVRRIAKRVQCMKGGGSHAGGGGLFSSDPETSITSPRGTDSGGHDSTMESSAIRADNAVAWKQSTKL